MYAHGNTDGELLWYGLIHNCTGLALDVAAFLGEKAVGELVVTRGPCFNGDRVNQARSAHWQGISTVPPLPTVLKETRSEPMAPT